MPLSRISALAPLIAGNVLCAIVFRRVSRVELLIQTHASSSSLPVLRRRAATQEAACSPSVDVCPVIPLGFYDFYKDVMILVICDAVLLLPKTCPFVWAIKKEIFFMLIIVN